jgi:N-acetylglutamate synthase-like GNAT family acetyltransferase
VAVESGAIVGYAAIESQFEQLAQGFRLFVVTQPERLAEIGSLLYGRVEGLLTELGAVEAWFIEYASDHRFLAFLTERGFEEARRFHLESEGECVVVSRRMDRP